MVLTPEWVLDGTDLALMTTSAQKADGKEMKKRNSPRAYFNLLREFSEKSNGELLPCPTLEKHSF
jgi:hypothetical protein